MVKPVHGVFIQSVADDGAERVPQWQRVQRAVRRAIEAGALRAGDRLPSARQLARDWGVSRGAVDEAFEQLQADGLLRRHVGDGSYVSGPDSRRAAEAPARREPAALARQVLQHGQQGQQAQQSQPAGGGVLRPAAARESAPALRQPLPLHPSATDVAGFPLAMWRRLLAASAAEEGRDLLAELPSAGLPALRKAIAHHLALERGVAVRPEQIFVTASLAEGLSLLARLFLPSGGTVWMEDPSHPSLPWLISSLGLQVRGVPLDAQGLDVDALRAASARLQREARSDGPNEEGGAAARGESVAPSLVVLHPLNHYPLAQRTAGDRASALLAWAEAHRAWVVESLFNDELWPRDAQPQALQPRAPERVFMLGTFEGIVFPSLRLAYVVVPGAQCARVADALTFWTARAPSSLQWALAQFIERGHLQQHLQALRAAHAAARALVRTVLLDDLPPAVRAGPLGPSPHLCLHLPQGCNDVDLVRRLRSHQLVVEPLSTAYWQADRRSGLVIGYVGWALPDLQAALRRLLLALQAEFAARPQARLRLAG